MNRIVLVATPLLALALAGCASTAPTQVASAPTVAAPVISTPLVPTPAQTTQQALMTTNISQGFVDSGALSRMSAKDSSEAHTAQYYAQQFGRPGAPRQWTGERGTTGSVAVGPYVRVNNLDCRDFTHTVKISGQDFVKKGTACREQNGNWAVVPGAA